MWDNDEVDEYLEPENESHYDGLSFRILPISADKDAIQILDGVFSGISVIFGKVSFLEEDDGLIIKFDHEVLENPNSMDLVTEDFVNYIGDILVQIMAATYKNK
jgi:hypothetical protein